MTAPQKAVLNAAHVGLRRLVRTDFVLTYFDARMMRLMFEVADALGEVMRKHG